MLSAGSCGCSLKTVACKPHTVATGDLNRHLDSSKCDAPSFPRVWGGKGVRRQRIATAEQHLVSCNATLSY